MTLSSNGSVFYHIWKSLLSSWCCIDDTVELVLPCWPSERRRDITANVTTMHFDAFLYVLKISGKSSLYFRESIREEVTAFNVTFAKTETWPTIKYPLQNPSSSNRSKYWKYPWFLAFCCSFHLRRQKAHKIGRKGAAWCEGASAKLYQYTYDRHKVLVIIPVWKL